MKADYDVRNSDPTSDWVRLGEDGRARLYAALRALDIELSYVYRVEVRDGRATMDEHDRTEDGIKFLDPETRKLAVRQPYTVDWLGLA